MKITAGKASVAISALSDYPQVRHARREAGTRLHGWQAYNPLKYGFLQSQLEW